MCTIEDVQKAYPLLDMVDHENRNAVAKGNHPDDETFPPLEGMIFVFYHNGLDVLVNYFVSCRSFNKFILLKTSQ